MRLKITVIEDDTSYLTYLKTILNDNDWDVATARYLEAGLKQVEDQAPEIVLLDLELPDTANLHMTLERFFDASASTAVIVLSSHDDTEIITQALQYGAQDYLVKKEITPIWLKRSIFKAIFNRYIMVRRRHVLQMTATEVADIWQLHQKQIFTLRKLLRELDENSKDVSNKLADIHGLISPIPLAKELEALKKVIST